MAENTWRNLGTPLKTHIGTSAGPQKWCFSSAAWMLRRFRASSFSSQNFSVIEFGKAKKMLLPGVLARTPVPRSIGVPVGASRCRSSTPDAHPRSASIPNSGCYPRCGHCSGGDVSDWSFAGPQLSSSPYTVQESIMWGITSEAVICLSFQTESPLPV